MELSGTTERTFTDVSRERLSSLIIDTQRKENRPTTMAKKPTQQTDSKANVSVNVEVGKMALTTLETMTINRGIALAKKLTSDIVPELRRLQVSYDAANAVKATVTQPNLDLATQFSGITKAQLDDAFFAMTSTLKTALDTAYAQIETLAERG